MAQQSPTNRSLARTLGCSSIVLAVALLGLGAAIVLLWYRDFIWTAANDPPKVDGPQVKVDNAPRMEEPPGKLDVDRLPTFKTFSIPDQVRFQLPKIMPTANHSFLWLRFTPDGRY